MEPQTSIDPDASDYLKHRWEKQVDYVEKKARRNQKMYITLRDIMLPCSWLTPITIFAQTLIQSNPWWNRWCGLNSRITENS